MKRKIFNGKKFASKRIARAKKIIDANPQLKKGKLRVMLVGDDSASIIYLGLKKKLFLSLGIGFEERMFSKKASVFEIVKHIQQANFDDSVRGIMVQLPFPDDWDNRKKMSVIESIDFKKDVDCLTKKRLKFISLAGQSLLPATVKAVFLILESIGINKNTLLGKKVSVLGKSDLIGKPTAKLLKESGATVFICDSKTRNIADKTVNSDIIISATGKHKLVKPDMIKAGAVVIDVGEPKGDVDFEKVKNLASFITPVPGGVGPVTISCLLENFLFLSGQHLKDNC